MPSTKVVALTGATGFIGSHILNSLLANGYHIRILVRSSNNTIINHPKIEVIIGDLHNHAALGMLTSNVDFIIHCAGRVKGANADAFVHDNVSGTKNILSSINQTDHCKFILVSSLSAREPSISNYASSKHASESALKQSNINHWTIIRPPAVYGPGDTELKPVFNWVKRGILWVPGAAKQLFSLLHVDDLSQLVINQLNQTTESRKIIEPDDGHQYSWQQIQQISECFFRKKITIVRVPSSVLSLAAHSNVLFSRILNYSPMLTPGKVNELLHDNWVCEGTSYISDWKAKVDLKTGLSTLYSNNDVN
ncbi:MAG: NAD-dependent epimerase/dehydratase family protein [Gammaproteobacteria bacterium]